MSKSLDPNTLIPYVAGTRIIRDVRDKENKGVPAYPVQYNNSKVVPIPMRTSVTFLETRNQMMPKSPLCTVA
jgi:hypothetical protein